MICKWGQTGHYQFVMERETKEKWKKNTFTQKPEAYFIELY